MIKFENKLSIKIFLLLFCLMQTGGCGTTSSYPIGKDRAPDYFVDVSTIPDAVPKVESPSNYGNNNYKVNGKYYHILKTAKGYDKRGYASWYGAKFHGQLTSSRERYNAYGMTAASPVLPLPSYVQVTNLQNGKKVIVKVNDRGPFCGNRIIDLTYAAAKKLGYAGQGTARVRVVAIDPQLWDIQSKKLIVAKNSTKNKNIVVAHNSQRKPSQIYLQVGAFTAQNNAKHESTKVASLTHKPVVVAQDTHVYRVQVGPLLSLAQSEQIKHLLERNGYSHLMTIRTS